MLSDSAGTRCRCQFKDPPTRMDVGTFCCRDRKPEHFEIVVWLFVTHDCEWWLWRKTKRYCSNLRSQSVCRIPWEVSDILFKNKCSYILFSNSPTEISGIAHCSWWIIKFRTFLLFHSVEKGLVKRNLLPPKEESSNPETAPASWQWHK